MPTVKYFFFLMQTEDLDNRLKTLQSDHEALMKSHADLENVNSMWAKKNVDLMAEVKELKVNVQFLILTDVHREPVRYAHVGLLLFSCSHGCLSFLSFSPRPSSALLALAVVPFNRLRQIYMHYT